MSPRNFFDIGISPHYDDDREDSFNEDTNNEILNCENCKGFITRCKFCQQTIEIQKKKPPLNYHEGSIHHCERRRIY